MDANDLIKNRNLKKNNWDQMPEGLSEIDSVNDTRSLHNRTGFTNGRRTDDEKTSNYAQSQYNTSNGIGMMNMAPDANGNFS